jgi:hypothetical protein
MSKVRDISNLSNVIRTDASGNVSFVSGSTTLATLNTSGQLSGSSPVLSSSYALNATSASYAVSASNATNAVTASFANAFTVANTLTATTLVVQTVTSSVIYSSGSNVFGNNIANTQSFTGSVSMTGSLAVITNGTEFQVTSTGVNLGNALTDSHTISGSLRINPNGLFISSSGFVGIGLTTPGMALDITGSVGDANGGMFRLTADGGGQLRMGASSSYSWVQSHSSKPLYINPLGNNIVMCLSAGSVGIGTSSPTGLGGKAFVVSAVSTYPEIIWERTGDGARKWGTLIGSDGSLLCRDYTSGNNVFNINPGAPNASLSISSAGWIYMPSITDGAGTYALKWRSGGLLSFDTSSARYKDNIRDSVYGLSDIMKLRSAMFEYKKELRTDIGLIAEEVYEVIPELVTLDDEGLPNAVAYDRFVSVLTKAIQELKSENDTLKEILQRNNIQ